MNKRTASTVAALLLGIAAAGLAQPDKPPAAPAGGGRQVKPEGIRAKPRPPAKGQPADQPDIAQPGDPAHPADNPGEAHAALARLAGEWTTSSAFTYGGEAQPPSAGKATIKSVLGGRFLSEENAGEMMGEPMSGFRFLGYSNATKQYEAAWAYTGSTSLLILKGTSTDGGKTIRLEGSYPDPQDGRHTLGVTMTVPGADRFTIRIAGVGEPPEQTAVLEITYTRAK